MEKIAVIGIVIEGDRSAAGEVQDILSRYGDAIIGRMGVPDKEHGMYAIAVIVRTNTETLSAITGKLGRIASVHVKSAVTSFECA